MEARISKLEAIATTLATKQDLAELELRVEKSIHSEINFFRQEVYSEFSLMRQEITGIHKEIGNIHREVGSIHKGMADFQKAISAQIMKAMVIMITISTSLSGLAIAIAIK